MRPIPIKMREQMANDEYYKRCARERVFQDHVCKGRITFEHCFVYAGRQINEVWAIIPLCEYAHFEILDKNKNQYISLKRATDDELDKYPRFNWQVSKDYLSAKYGHLDCELKGEKPPF